MLYIIYGLTLIVTKSTLAHFRSQGIRVIDKYTWSGPDTRIQASNPIARPATQQEVEACDYIYENHGRMVGFTSDQIETAVNGMDDALLTFSSGDLSFLREIKTAYGNHVTIVYAYIDEQALEALTNDLPFPETQKRERLAMGRIIRERFLTERDLFDEVVLFSGEGTQFDLDRLNLQYDHIIKKYSTLEADPLYLPYTGNKPYIFVSYARADSDKVIPILQNLHRNGCRIWFDQGIRGGDNWLTTLALKIKHCTQYLLFSSEASTHSNWTKKEILQALDHSSIRTLTVRLDDARFNEGIEMGLKGEQHLFAWMPNFEQALLESIAPEVIAKLGPL